MLFWEENTENFSGGKHILQLNREKLVNLRKVLQGAQLHLTSEWEMMKWESVCMVALLIFGAVMRASLCMKPYLCCSELPKGHLFSRVRM